VALAVNGVIFGSLVGGLIYGAFGLIDAVVGVDVATAFQWSWMPEGIAGWLGDAATGFLGAVGGVLKVLAVGGVLMGSPMLFRVLAVSLLPVYQGRVFLAARRAAGGSEPSRPLPTLMQTVAVEVRRFSTFLFVSACLFLLNVIPGIGTLLYGVLQFLYAAEVLGWDLLSHHFELEGLTWGEQRAWIKRNRWTVWTLGGVSLGLAMVPVLQLVFITTNVAGAGVLSAALAAHPVKDPPVP
jgi:uncharacterized protein involved in cysteine biosynthesis